MWSLNENKPDQQLEIKRETETFFLDVGDFILDEKKLGECVKSSKRKYSSIQKAIYTYKTKRNGEKAKLLFEIKRKKTSQNFVFFRFDYVM